jgi:hypothetical protein
VDASKLVFCSVDNPYSQYYTGGNPKNSLNSRVNFISFYTGLLLQSNTYGVHHFNEPNQSFFNNGVCRLTVKQTSQGSL